VSQQRSSSSSVCAHPNNDRLSRTRPRRASFPQTSRDSQSTEATASVVVALVRRSLGEFPWQAKSLKKIKAKKPKSQKNELNLLQRSFEHIK
jgi:hypothetical protein